VQILGLPVSAVTLAASCDMTIISQSFGVNDIALTRPVSCSTGVHNGGAAATVPTCTVYTTTKLLNFTIYVSFIQFLIIT